MKLKLSYGKSQIEFEIPSQNLSGIIRPEKVEPLKFLDKKVKKSLNHPIGSNKLSKKVNSNDNVVILASDITRPVPTRFLLPPIIEKLRAAGVKEKNIKIIFGLGIHRKHNPEEKKELVGEKIYQKYKCIDHDLTKCNKIGVTEHGTEVEIFEEVLKADFIIATGNLEFHYFAGFSGGAKALAPGVCGRKTIMQNHQKFLDPKAKSGQIEKNPIREEIEEIGQMVGIDFIVNCVLNDKKEVIKVVSGHVTSAHRAGKKYIEKIYSKEIDNLADIVITSPGGDPKDIDLYQTHKAMEHANMALKNDGIMIVIGKCADGLGEDKFAKAMTEGESPESLARELENNFVLGRHKASRIAMLYNQNQIYLVSALSKRIRNKLFIECFDDVNQALQNALKKKGEDSNILVIPFGASTLPNY